LLAGVTLAMAMLPEEFVVLTVFLALGAWRISQAGPHPLYTRRRNAWLGDRAGVGRA
jgi:hypothetical protein